MATRNYFEAGGVSPESESPHSPSDVSNTVDATQAFGSHFSSTADFEQEIRNLRAERDELALRFAALPRATSFAAIQLVEADKALLSIRQARDAVLARSAELTAKLAHAQETIAELSDAVEFAERSRESALERLSQVQRECTELRSLLIRLERERSAAPPPAADSPERLAELIEQRLQHQFDAAKAASDARISALQSQLEASIAKTPPSGEVERQRLEIAELRAELDSVREELRKERLPEIESRRPAEAPSQPAPDIPVPVGLDVPELIQIPELENDLQALSVSLGAIKADPSQLETVDVLASQFQDLAQRALAAGCLGAHRLATVCADVAGWLRKSPAKIPGMCGALEEARALLGQLAKPASAARAGDPGGSLIYAVDDDVDNCECIAMALEKATLHTHYAMKPEIALTELQKSHVDLIILDVDLGGDIDGFQLHERIRGLEGCRNTPTLFVSGHSCARDRVKELTGDDSGYVAKPYNLNELTLKALMSILKGRLVGE